jgi:hypothetical protein
LANYNQSTDSASETSTSAQINFFATPLTKEDLGIHVGIQVEVIKGKIILVVA